MKGKTLLRHRCYVHVSIFYTAEGMKKMGLGREVEQHKDISVQHATFQTDFE